MMLCSHNNYLFNKEKEQNRLKAVGMLSDIGSQAADIARTQGELNGLKAAQEATGEMLPANATEAQRQSYLARLRDTQVYKDEVAKYGTGSDMQRGIQTVTAALQGLAGGNIGGALAGASAPELANIIGHHAGIENNPAARGIAHALLGGVTAALQGNSAAAGAAGAATGELVATAIAGQLYPGTAPGKLTEEQKQTVSTLATIAAGMAGGIAGGNTAGAAAGASGGKNAAENNNLGLPSGLMSYGQSVQSYAQYAQDKNLSPEQVQADLAQMVKGDLPESADIIKAILSNNPGSDTVMAVLSAQDAKDYALALLTSIPAEKALSLVGKGLTVIDNKILISAAEKISTAKPGKQFTAPRDLNEQIVWKQVQESPASGEKLIGMNNDPRFPISAGFQKMQATHKLPDGSSITIHYQYNSTTGKAYDMKIDSAQPKWPQPGVSLKDK